MQNMLEHANRFCLGHFTSSFRIHGMYHNSLSAATDEMGDMILSIDYILRFDCEIIQLWMLVHIKGSTELHNRAIVKIMIKTKYTSIPFSQTKPKPNQIQTQCDPTPTSTPHHLRQPRFLFSKTKPNTSTHPSILVSMLNPRSRW